MYGGLTDAGVLFVLVPVRYGTAAHIVGAGKKNKGKLSLVICYIRPVRQYRDFQSVNLENQWTEC